MKNLFLIITLTWLLNAEAAFCDYIGNDFGEVTEDQKKVLDVFARRPHKYFRIIFNSINKCVYERPSIMDTDIPYPQYFYYRPDHPAGFAVVREIELKFDGAWQKNNMTSDNTGTIGNLRATVLAGSYFAALDSYLEFNPWKAFDNIIEGLQGGSGQAEGFHYIGKYLWRSFFYVTAPSSFYCTHEGLTVSPNREYIEIDFEKPIVLEGFRIYGGTPVSPESKDQTQAPDQGRLGNAPDWSHVAASDNKVIWGPIPTSQRKDDTSPKSEILFFDGQE